LYKHNIKQNLNKIKIEKIENSKIRQVTFYKRKRGLLKKAMELSLLCESKIFLCIVDKVEKLTIYSSENDINKFLGTYLQKINQNKIQKDILSNNDYNTLFTNASTKDESSKAPEDMIYSYENDQTEENKPRSMINHNVDYEEIQNDNKLGYMNYQDNFDSFGMNHDKEDFNLYLNQHTALFDEEQDHNTTSYRLNSFKAKSEDDGSFENSTSNMNQIFSTIFSTDNNSVTSNNSPNNSACKQKTDVTDRKCNVNKLLQNNTLNSKRNREDNKKPQMKNKMLENLPSNLNFAVINPQNLASLFPNLLSQNIGVVNWVVPMNNVENN